MNEAVQALPGTDLGASIPLSPLRERVARELSRERGATVPDAALPSPDPRSREGHPPPQRGEGNAPNELLSAPGLPHVRSSFGPNALKHLKGPALALAIPAALALIWHLATVGKPYSLIPPPSEVWTEMRDLAFGGINDDAFSGTLWTHLAASLARVFGGFALAAAAALPLGLLIGRVPLMRALLDPTFQILRPVPVTAWLPLAMILFGLGPRSAYFLVFLGAFYPILVNTIFGVRSVEPRLFEAAAMLGCTGPAQFARVVLPAALPSIFTGLRLGLGFAWVVIVVGEMTGVQTGLGAIIMEARQLSRTEIVICGMVVIGIAGFVSDRIVMEVGRRLLAWSPAHG